jgi:hypothetical protein
MKKLAVPKFATEAEEAKWWDEHMDAVGENLIAVMKSGTAHRGGPRRVLQERRESRNITIRMPLTDLQAAQEMAQKKGLPYQTYMKMLLHQALEKERRAS